MKRVCIALGVWLCCALTWAGPTDPNDIRVVQNNANVPSNGTLTRYVAFPAASASCLLVLDGPSTLPACANIGSGMSYSGGTLTASGTAQVNADWAASSGVAQILSKPTTLTGYGITDGVRSVTAGTGLSGGTITGSGTISLPNTGTAGTYSGVSTDAQGRVTAGTSRSFSYPTRALNTCFQISSTRDALVSYAVEIGVQSTLAAGQVGTVYLETFSNSSCSTGTQEIVRGKIGLTQGLGLSVTLDGSGVATLSGIIPAGAWAKLRSENSTGDPTFTARPGQEVLL